VEFPDGLGCVPAPTFDDDTWIDAPAGFDPEPLDAIEVDADPWPEITRLALLLPDGTVIATETFGLATARGWRRCEIEPYGGRLSVDDPVTPADAETFDEPDADADSEVDDRPDDESRPFPDTASEDDR
jgi:hypothetical protein